MGEEYNLLYINLRNRLKLLKILNDSDISLTENEKLQRLTQIDSLQKVLDSRYSDSKNLYEVEYAVKCLEK